MEFDYILTEDDYLRFNDFNAFKTVHGKNANKKRMVLLPVLLLAALGLMAVNGADLMAIGIEAALFIGGLTFFTYYRRTNYQKMLQKYIARNLKQGKMMYSDAGKMVFTETYLEDQGKLGTLRINYSNIYAVYPNVSNLYVYESPSRAIVIPGSIYESGEEKNELWEFLRKKIPAEKWMNGR